MTPIATKIGPILVTFFNFCQNLVPIKIGLTVQIPKQNRFFERFFSKRELFLYKTILVYKVYIYNQAFGQPKIGRHSTKSLIK